MRKGGKRAVIVGNAKLNPLILSLVRGMLFFDLFRMQLDFYSFTLLVHKNAERRLLA